MVREEERVGNNVPSGVPGEVLLIEKNTHQLGNRERGMGLGVQRVSTAIRAIKVI